MSRPYHSGHPVRNCGACPPRRPALTLALTLALALALALALTLALALALGRWSCREGPASPSHPPGANTCLPGPMG